MGTLNPNQKRYVLSTFGYVDGLLRAVEEVADAAPSPFSRHRPDLTGVEVRLLRAFLAAARGRMLEALRRLDIERPAPSVSARWSVLTKLAFVDVGLSELEGKRLRGYGAVDAEAVAVLEALAADLRAFVERGRALLHEGDNGGLAAQLATLEGPAGEVLRALERISTEHGLVELRSLISAAAERARSSTYDVGVFGHVSAGKSSLINALAGEAVLPVGVTPVTAVPVRLKHGPRAATVHLRDQQPEHIDVGNLVVYVTEEQNPDNRLGVQAVDCSLPSLADGLCLLDTPGVGSLATSGAAQAFAWLPRCDLGLVLVASGSALGRDDLALVSGLQHAGIACMVLLSKSDLLGPEALAESLAYLRRELARTLGPEQTPDVWPVSTRAATPEQLARFRREVLHPRITRHRENARAALQARLRRLVAATHEALQGREQAVDEQRLTLQRARQEAANHLRAVTDRLAGASALLVDEAAGTTAAAWVRGDDPAEAVQGLLVQAAHQALEQVRDVAASFWASFEGVPLPEPCRFPPIFAPPLLYGLPDLAPPRLLPALQGRRRAARRLDGLRQELHTALSRYAGSLHDWGLHYLDELTEAAPGAAPEAPRSGAPPPVASNGALARLGALIDAMETAA